MTIVIRHDFLFNALIKAVSEWYDEHYFGSPEECNALKEAHLQTLKDLYDPERFKNAVDLNEEKIEFLTEVQGAVETQFAVYGYG